ncbi:hypothetical protein BCR33DRAFT_233483 [Rhizoclosmatium globosum]|uniref:MYND-type domain-containing protein n=1 Tax=Rhizoclosmatium globosum TaxID=329046 RepID=A0A1Y2CAF2_9FUNG|nr:hypothetical protein BCR33DRAFT_233483 [Rhizoclosmatium globosum]|eukprot:ORY44018.1 hypothetical protein BCR33DRAFT_233483 [Rhizoclosmatium globosum]
MRIQAAALIKVNPDRPLAEEKVQHLYRMCQRVVAFKSVCVVCKTTSGDAQRKLEYCAACKTVKYCSKECQRVHWKAGHKRCCRPAQDLRKGDIVQLQGLVARSDLNGSYRELGEFNQEKGRWEVTWLRGSNGILIKPDNLVRAVTVEEMVDFYAITGGIPSFF